MSVIEEILQIKNKLSIMSNEKTTCRDEALDLLRTLQKMPMTVELLIKTRIGLSVNTFRKSSVDYEVVCLAKEILRDWKKFIPEHVSQNHISSATTDTKETENSADNIEKDMSTSVIISDENTRLKCRELLENALVLYAGLLKDCTCPKKFALELENIIYQQLKNTSNSCGKCLKRKERKEHSKQMESTPKAQEDLLPGSIEQSHISENQHTELQQKGSKGFNLLQRFKELGASSLNNEENNSQDMDFIP